MDRIAEQPVFDLDGVMRRLQDDREFLVLLLDTFLTDLPDRLGKMRCAQEEARMPDLARLAHSLKGASATVGAVRMQHRAAALDAACRADDLVAARRVWEDVLNDVQVTRDAMSEWLAAARAA